VENGMVYMLINVWVLHFANDFPFCYMCHM